MVDAPITTGERLITARRSSHLRLKTHERCDLDFIIAAACVGDRLGGLLYGLMSEFDCIRAEVQDGPALNSAELVLVMSRLKGLEETKRRLFAWACVEDTRLGLKQTDQVVATLTGRVLATFLEPNCHHCEGRGFTGGTHRGDPQIPCRPCRSAGQRREWIGRNATETKFATHLLGAMQERVDSVDKAIRAYLADVIRPDLPSSKL